MAIGGVHMFCDGKPVILTCCHRQTKTCLYAVSTQIQKRPRLPTNDRDWRISKLLRWMMQIGNVHQCFVEWLEE